MSYAVLSLLYEWKRQLLRTADNRLQHRQERAKPEKPTKMDSNVYELDPYV